MQLKNDRKLYIYIYIYIDIKNSPVNNFGTANIAAH